ncbi:hypothetical protein Thimo_2645 [Thioflavicoccus mobilis 8321]|uniref:SPOR domain-containing protein n=1 Tax=Thioflavicoccus mobilis 8321 TaxID=765912 RepID=L0H157_9GAMM|nr:SPOR domain-containing protein [Thioflavicoccus mobilis]AGA91365.1 hypothetical protein Thimo_2645 [Thioflavicoccus mobilis 8321]
MDEAAKKRLIGAVVLVLLMVIFVPMLFEEPPPAPDQGLRIEAPEESDLQSQATNEVFILPTSPDTDVQSLAADEMAPIDTLMPDEQAAFEAPEPQPAESSPPVEAPAPIEPVAEPTKVDEPAPVAVRPAPTRAPPVVRPGSFVIQIAALSTIDRAAELVSELRRHGFNSFSEKAEVNGKTYFRVRVGPEPNRAAATRLAETLKRETGYQGQVLVQQ